MFVVLKSGIFSTDKMFREKVVVYMRVLQSFHHLYNGYARLIVTGARFQWGRVCHLISLDWDTHVI